MASWYRGCFHHNLCAFWALSLTLPMQRLPMLSSPAAWNRSMVLGLSYGWWYKSCITLRTLNYGSYGLFLIWGDAGFTSLTVAPEINTEILIAEGMKTRFGKQKRTDIPASGFHVLWDSTLYMPCMWSSGPFQVYRTIMQCSVTPTSKRSVAEHSAQGMCVHPERPFGRTPLKAGKEAVGPDWDNKMGTT